MKYDYTIWFSYFQEPISGELEAENALMAAIEAMKEFEKIEKHPRIPLSLSVVESHPGYQSIEKLIWNNE